MPLGLGSVPVRNLSRIARLSSFHCSDVLHTGDLGSFSAAHPAARYATALSSLWLPRAPWALCFARLFYGNTAVALQAAVHLAGSVHRAPGRSGLLALAKIWTPIDHHSRVSPPALLSWFCGIKSRRAAR